MATLDSVQVPEVKRVAMTRPGLTGDSPSRRCWIQMVVASLLIALSILAVASAPVGAQTTGAVSGTLRWIDATGQTHPGREVVIRIEQAGSVLASATTDERGDYTFSAVPAGQLQLAIEFTNVVPAPGSDPYVLRADIVSVPADPDGVTADFTLTSATPSGRFLSIHQALLLTTSWLGAEAQVEAVYPPLDGRTTSAYFPANDVMVIAEDDVYDWDVITHEHGHAIAVRGGFSATPGEPFPDRILGVNLASAGNLQDGLELAWAEGWATFFTLWTQQRGGGAALGIDGVGDTRYTDRDSNGQIELDLDFGSPSDVAQYLRQIGAQDAGDNEVTIARALWAAFNENPVAEARLLDALRSGSPTTLAEAAVALRPELVPGRFDCVLSAAGYLPQPRSPVQQAVLGAGAPFFSWRSGGAAAAAPPDAFVIEFRRISGELLYSTEVSSQTNGVSNISTYTPTVAEWDRIRTFGIANWSVRFGDGDPGACTQQFQATQALDVSHSTSCLYGRNAVRVSITNTSTRDLTATVVLSTTEGTNRLRPRVVGVPAGATSATLFAGRPDDGWQVEVFDEDGLAGLRPYDAQFRLSCQEDSRDPDQSEWTLQSWCFAGNGRIDATLRNPADRTLGYVVEVDGTITKRVTVNPAAIGTVSITGRPDGARQVKIFRDDLTEPLVDEVVSVACDVRSLGREVVPMLRCEREGGRLDVYVFNTSPDTVSYTVALEDSVLEPRTVTLPPWTSGLATWTARPNGLQVMTLDRDGGTLFTDTFDINC